MVALNFTLPAETYRKAGRRLGKGSSGAVYAFGPFVVKMGYIPPREARIGRTLHHRLPDHTVEVYKYRGSRGEESPMLFMARADVPTLAKTMQRKFRGERRRTARIAAVEDVLDLVTQQVRSLGWLWTDEHSENVMYGTTPDGRQVWQLVDYEGLQWMGKS